jgi:hypothetical protein
MLRALTRAAPLLLAAVVGCMAKSRPTADQGPTSTPTPTTPQCTSAIDPGHVTIRRLNRAEYDNTVRDLLGDNSRPASDFPADDQGGGFDNNGDVLTIAPLLVEKYELAAQHLIENAIQTPINPVAQTFSAQMLMSSVGGPYNSYWNLDTNGTITTPITAPIDGVYTLAVRAFGQQAGPDPARMTIHLDNQPLKTFDVLAVEAMPAVYSFNATISQGVHSFDVAFINDYYDPTNVDPTQRDRNLVVDYLSFTGPLNGPPPETAARKQIMICDPRASTNVECAGRILGSFAKRAWRRPVAQEEIDRLVALANVAWMQGDDFDTGIRTSLEGVLLSPHFLFRVELDPDPNAPTPHAVSPWELASRMSYFLWSSMPDDHLFSLAESGQLTDPKVIAVEVLRMLHDDQKIQAFVENFAGQWLYTRAIDNVTPDPVVFPSFDEPLRQAERGETYAYFKYFLTADESALDMLDSPMTFVNDRLARHYGLPIPGTGNDLVQVATGTSARGGILTQASILTVTSNTRRTSPVRRGKWVFENLLCGHVNPPPPNVPPLPEDMGQMPTGSVRDRLEEHRKNPVCASCHKLMDPIGFGLENFDAIGAFRTRDSGFPIDATGTLPDGRAFDGAKQMAQLIKSSPQFERCMIRAFYTYALGRLVDDSADACLVDGVDAQFIEADHKMSWLVTAIAQSPGFVSRRGQTVTSTGGAN